MSIQEEKEFSKGDFVQIKILGSFGTINGYDPKE